MITRNAESKTTQVRLAPTAAAPGKARVAVKQSLAACSRDTIEITSLLVSELVTNSVCHGHAVLNASVVVRIARNGSYIRIEVVDWGQGFEYRTRARPLDEMGGWGLHLVDQLSTRWGVERGAPNVVWFELSDPQ
ncbi:MAG: ATP-binding protein [Actinomycetota bacterium]